MRALSIRQPYAELILRGLKTIEYRSLTTKIIGEPFFIYASQSPCWPGDRDQYELLGCEPSDLLTGLIVGTATIIKCAPAGATNAGPCDKPEYEWHLANVQRLDQPRKPTGHPQPVWFKPF